MAQSRSMIFFMAIAFQVWAFMALATISHLIWSSIFRKVGKGVNSFYKIFRQFALNLQWTLQVCENQKQ